MPGGSFFDSSLFLWVVLPALIFTARVLDVSLGTVRLVFVARGYKGLAPMVGFFEVLIWIVAIGQIMKHLSNPMCYLAYAGGFASGNYVGMWIAERLSLGMVMIRVVTQRDTSQLMTSLTAAQFGVTVLDAQGVQGQVRVLFTIVPKREVAEVIGQVKQFNPNAFYTIEEVDSVQYGIFPARKPSVFKILGRTLFPIRKGK